MFDVITIGTATRDVFLKSPAFRTVRVPKHLRLWGIPTGEAQCFPAGSKLEVDAPTLTVGGGAANAAVTFARQGFRAAALVKLGKDPNGRAVLDDLAAEKVRAIPVWDEVSTAYSVILLSPAGERTILHYRGASQDLRVRDAAALPRTRWAYLVPGSIPLPVMTRLVSRLRAQGTLIAMNPSQHYIDLGLRRLRPLLNSISVILMNREEASALTGVSFGNERKIFRKFDDVVKGIAVMTEGSKGVLVSDGRTLCRAGTYREKTMKDRTGAGDAFGSGFVAGLMRTRWRPGRTASLPMAVALGSANATSVVEQVGAQAGILTRRRFERETRWARFRVHTEQL